MKLIISFLIYLLTACSEKPQHIFVTPEKVNVRALEVVGLLPLSGVNAKIGENLKNMIDLAINTEDFKPVKFFNSDTQTEEAINYINQNNVKFVIGPVTSHESQFLQKAVPNAIISSYSNNESIASNNLYLFGINPERQFEKTLKYIRENGTEHLYMIAPRNELSKNMVNLINSSEDLSNFVVVKLEYYNHNSFEFAKNSILQSLKAEVPNNAALIILSNSKEFYEIIEEAIQNNIDITKLQIVGSSQYDDFTEVEREIIKGSIFADMNEVRLQELYNLFYNRYGENPEKISVYGYEMIQIIKQLNYKFPRTLNNIELNTVTGKTIFKNNILIHNLEIIH